MIYPSHAASLTRFGFQTNNTSNVAVLINTPEHYDRSGQHLVGSQALRVRQLAVMGFKVMNINMNKANKLMVHPNKLKDYLQRLYQQANVLSEDQSMIFLLYRAVTVINVQGSLKRIVGMNI